PQALCSRAALARLCRCCWAQPNSSRQPPRAASSRSGSVVPSTSIPTSSPWRWRDPLGSPDRAGKQQKAHILPQDVGFLLLPDMGFLLLPDMGFLLLPDVGFLLLPDVGFLLLPDVGFLLLPDVGFL